MNEIHIFGEIGTDVTAADVKVQLAQADQSKELVVRFDTNGGSVFQGFSIHEAFAQYAGPKRAVIESAAFSIGSYMLTAFDNVEIAGNGYVMLHNPKMELFGDDEMHAKASVDLAKYKASMIADYVAKTGRSESEITETLRAETYMNAQEAVAFGIANKILESSIASRVLASHKDHLPYRVCASLDAPDGTTPTPTEKPMAEKNDPVAASVSEIKAAFPKASSDFKLSCIERNLTIAEVAEELAQELQTKNDDLLAKNEELQAKLAEANQIVEAAEASQKEAAEAVAAAKGNQPIANVNGGDTKTATCEWNEAVKACLSEGLSKPQAVKAANRRNPGLRERFVAEANAR